MLLHYIAMPLALTMSPSSLEAETYFFLQFAKFSRSCPNNFTSTYMNMNFILSHIHKSHFINKFGPLYQNISKFSIFCDIMPCSLLKVNISKGHITSSFKMLCLSPAFTLVSCSAYSSTVKMAVICSFKTSTDYKIVTVAMRTSNPTKFCMPNNFSLCHLHHTW
jgi:hypothetical protein